MLRRGPTLITLTAEDVAAYEESRRERLTKASALHNAAGAFSPGEDEPSQGLAKNPPAWDPNDELKPLPGDKARVVRYGATMGSSAQGSPDVGSSRARTREERIGVSRR